MQALSVTNGLQWYHQAGLHSCLYTLCTQCIKSHALFKPANNTWKSMQHRIYAAYNETQFLCDFKWTIRLQSFVTHCLTQLQGYNLQRWAFSKQNWRLQQMLCCSHVITDESFAGTNRCCCMGFVPFGKRWRIFPSVSRRAGGSLNRPSTRVCRMGPHRVMGNGVINNSDLP